jgi:hypothetical protein
LLALDGWRVVWTEDASGSGTKSLISHRLLGQSLAVARLLLVVIIEHVFDLRDPTVFCRLGAFGCESRLFSLSFKPPLSFLFLLTLEKTFELKQMSVVRSSFATS